MNRFLVLLIGIIFLLTGCGGSNTKAEVEKAIQDAFKARADTVFLYKDKKPLEQYFSREALAQTSDFLAWSPNGQWENAKNLKYSYRISIRELKPDGQQATAAVYETAVITWDYINPGQVMGTNFIKEDAWGNRKHLVTLKLDESGHWLISADIVER